MRKLQKAKKRSMLSSSLKEKELQFRLTQALNASKPGT